MCLVSHLPSEQGYLYKNTSIVYLLTIFCEAITFNTLKTRKLHYNSILLLDSVRSSRFLYRNILVHRKDTSFLLNIVPRSKGVNSFTENKYIEVIY